MYEHTQEDVTLAIVADLTYGEDRYQNSSLTRDQLLAKAPIGCQLTRRHILKKSAPMARPLHHIGLPGSVSPTPGMNVIASYTLRKARYEN